MQLLDARPLQGPTGTRGPSQCLCVALPEEHVGAPRSPRACPLPQHEVRGRTPDTGCGTGTPDAAGSRAQGRLAPAPEGSVRAGVGWGRRGAPQSQRGSQLLPIDGQLDFISRGSAASHPAPTRHRQARGRTQPLPRVQRAARGSRQLLFPPCPLGCAPLHLGEGLGPPAAHPSSSGASTLPPDPVPRVTDPLLRGVGGCCARHSRVLVSEPVRLRVPGHPACVLLSSWQWPRPLQAHPSSSHGGATASALSARLAGINTITITWSPRGQPASPPPAPSLASLAACQGCWGWWPPEWLSGDIGRGRRAVRGPGGLTCGPQADVHTASLELAAALVLGHNEVATVIQAGDDGGEVAVLAAAGEMGRRDPERPGAQQGQVSDGARVRAHVAPGHSISAWRCLMHASACGL